MTTTPTDEAIRAEAERMLRERLRQSGWYPGVPKEERERLIEEDVQRHWFLLIHEATARLSERMAQGDAGEAQAEEAKTYLPCHWWGPEEAHATELQSSY